MTRHQFPSSRALALRCSGGFAFVLMLAAAVQAEPVTVTPLITDNADAIGTAHICLDAFLVDHTSTRTQLLVIVVQHPLDSVHWE